MISRYPFLETAYHPFTGPSTVDQPGLTNRGITYGKIQSPFGPVHLFCSHLATAGSGMNPGAAEPLNAAQSQEVLDFIQAKAHGEMAVFLADTGSGPAVANSPTGAANAQWPSNFTVLQGGLTDALLSNRNSDRTPVPAPACTFGCNGGVPAGAPSYVDHIMSAGRGVLPGSNNILAPLCHSNGSLTLTDSVVETPQGLLPLSTHFGVRSDISPCDLLPPTITCPAPVTVPNGQPIVLGLPSVVDNVDLNPTISSNAPTTYPAGTTVVRWSARDFSGNTATCEQTVTVQLPGFTNVVGALKIERGKKLKTGSLDLKMTFTLGAGNNGIAPLTEPVVVQVGSLTFTIPSGSFRVNRKGKFTFEGTTNGVSIEAAITPVSSGRYQLTLEAVPVNVSGISNRASVTVKVGDDQGTVTVPVAVD